MADSGSRAELGPDDLPISTDLASALAQWATEYDGIFTRVAGRHGFESEVAAEAFVELGRRLVVRLQEELGGSWVVEYHPEAVRPPGIRLR